MRTLPLAEMTREEKLLAFEALWADLAGDDVESPQWHADELAATEQRVKDGLEKFEDWDKVKTRLQSRYK